MLALSLIASGVSFNMLKIKDINRLHREHMEGPATWPVYLLGGMVLAWILIIVW